MFKGYFIVSLVILTIFIVGCSESNKAPTTNNDDENTTPIGLGKQFHIRVGQVKLVQPGDILVKLIKVTDDSRCPSDVTCIWAGQVKVALNVIIGGQDFGETTLTLGVNNDNDQDVRNISGYYVKVLAVNPYPISTKAIEQSDYIVTFIISTAVDEQIC